MRVRKAVAVVGFLVLSGAGALGTSACSSPPPANPDVKPQACEELDALKENFPEKDPPKDLVAECT